jgi:hypothetical protein
MLALSIQRRRESPALFRRLSLFPLMPPMS